MKEKYNTNVPGHNKCQIPNLGDMYLEVFGYKRNGNFVEVGAYDGVSWSNTFGLAAIGWGGALYEPVNSYYKRCSENLKMFINVKVINKAISNKVGKTKIYLGEAISTIDEKIINNYEKVDYFKGILKKDRYEICEINTLDNELQENNIPEGFELLIIDVEGAEYSVLEGFDIKKWSPKMVIIEMNEEDENEILKKDNDIINKYFADNNYKKIYKDKINTIFVKS